MIPIESKLLIFGASNVNFKVNTGRNFKTINQFAFNLYHKCTMSRFNHEISSTPKGQRSKMAKSQDSLGRIPPISAKVSYF